MDEERVRLLAKTITVKKENLGSLKRLHLPGEAAYDYASCLSTKDSKGSFKRVCGPVPTSVVHHDMSRCTTKRITSTPIPSGVNIECSESDRCDNGMDLNVNDLLPEMVSGEGELVGSLDFYKYSLITNKGVIINQIGQVLIMCDMDMQRKELMKDCFAILQRQAFKFVDGTLSWIIWCCSCSDDGLKLRNLNSHVDVAISEVVVSRCVHVTIATDIFERFDCVNNIRPFLKITGVDHDYSTTPTQVDNDWFPVTINDLCVGICVNKMCDPGIVTVKSERNYCLTCRKNFCEHCTNFQKLKTEGCEEFIETFGKMTITSGNSVRKGQERHDVFSVKRIPFIASDFTASVLRSLSLVQQMSTLCPSFVPCQCGFLDFKECTLYEECHLITLTYIATVKGNCKISTQNKNGVVITRCKICSTYKYYDAEKNGLLDMGTYMVGYDVLRRYMHSFLHGKRPMHSFHQVTCEMLNDYGYHRVPDIFTYNKFRLAWYTFVNSLDIDIHIGFSCPDCGTTPDLVVCDGTSLAFQKRMWTWREVNQEKQSHFDFQSRFHERIFTSNVRLRRYLKRYANGGRTVNGKKIELLSGSEKQAMMNESEKTSKPLHEFLAYVDDGSMVAPKSVQDLVLSLSSTSPVCSYIHVNSSVGQLIDALTTGINIKNNPEQWNNLREHIPIIFNLVDQSSITTIPQVLVDLLEELWNTSKRTFDVSIQQGPETDMIEEDELSYFPSLPKVRNRGVYKADVCIKATKATKSCKKNYTGHPTLLPGVFTLYCPHGICCGFQVMRCHESPDVPFSILRCRFSKAPKTVIYDNACSLHNYVLNRDPIFFKETNFYVDRLHWDNHTGCSSGYSLGRYPLLAGVNSQVNEQGNAGLQRIKDQLSYMTTDNFMRHCSFFLWNKNRLKRQML